MKAAALSELKENEGVDGTFRSGEKSHLNLPPLSVRTPASTGKTQTDKAQHRLRGRNRCRDATPARRLSLVSLRLLRPIVSQTSPAKVIKSVTSPNLRSRNKGLTKNRRGASVCSRGRTALRSACPSDSNTAALITGRIYVPLILSPEHHGHIQPSVSG